MNIRNLTDVKTIFFGNKTLRQTLFKNSFWLSLSEGISKLLKFILFVYLARNLGVAEYGRLNFALSFLGLFVVLPNLVHAKITIREFSRDRGKEKEFNSILSLRILLSLANLFLIFVILFFADFEPETKKIMAILAGYVVLEHFLGFLNFFFESRQRMEYEALINIGRALLLTIFVFFAILNFPSVANASYSYLLASLTALVLILLIIHFKFYPLRLAPNRAVWKRYITMSWPFFASTIFSGIYDQIDSVILSSLKQIAETGWYNAAYKIAGGIFIPVSLISGSFYPILNKTFGESKERFGKICNYFMETMIFLAVPVVLGGMMLAPQIITFFYGSQYTPSVLALQILLLMAGITFLQHPFYQTLLVFNQQTKLFWINVAGAIINVILNFVLIPRYGLYGAAVTALITSFSMLLIYIRYILAFRQIRLFNLRFFWTGIFTIFSGLVMYTTINFFNFYNFHIFLLIIAGALSYTMTFLALRFIVDYLNILRNGK